MAKQKIQYSCNGCGYISLKWLGCCPECKEWDTLIEDKPAPSLSLKEMIATAPVGRPISMHALDTISAEQRPRMKAGLDEWDRVLGDGIMAGSLIVLTGDPGIGKSTLLLQVCNLLAYSYRVFYFSTEESLHQVKQRAQRLKCINETLLFSDNADLATILATAEQERPDIMVIDSIQNCFIEGAQSLPGSVGQ